MKNLNKFFGIILLSIFIFSACNENISDPQTVSNDQKSLAKKMSTEKAQQIAKVMAANNLGQGAYFIEPLSSGLGIGIGKNITFECVEDDSGNIIYCGFTGGELAFFDGSFGKGDFMRINPNGTVSVKLTTNQANAAYFDLTNNEAYFGTGNMNSKFTGTIEEFCFYDEFTDSTYCFSFLMEDPNINAWILHGNASVTLDGAGGDSHKLNMFLNLNPGGPGKVDFTFN